MMSKQFFFKLLFVFVASTFVACDKNNDPDPEPEKRTGVGVYILNAGTYQGSNSTLDTYDPNKKEVQLNVFQQVNSRKLGDTGQDLLIYGSKIYISVFGSNQIQVTDLTCQSIRTIELKNQANQPHPPRYLAAHGGMVYVSLFDGYVAKIDTANLEVQGKVAVGSNPEQIAVANNKLFVCNSGGMNYPNYDKTISVIDLASFSVIETVEVVANPTSIATDEKNNIYVVSMGNYKDIPNTLQRIDPVSYHVTKLANITRMAIHRNLIYTIAVVYDENFNETIALRTYDIQKGEMKPGSFITDGTPLSHINSMDVDPATGTIYIGTSDYKNTGDMYVFSPEGKQMNKIALSGSDVKGAYFLPVK